MLINLTQEKTNEDTSVLESVLKVPSSKNWYILVLALNLHISCVSTGGESKINNTLTPYRE